MGAHCISVGSARLARLHAIDYSGSLGLDRLRAGFGFVSAGFLVVRFFEDGLAADAIRELDFLVAVAFARGTATGALAVDGSFSTWRDSFSICRDSSAIRKERTSFSA